MSAEKLRRVETLRSPTVASTADVGYNSGDAMDADADADVGADVGAGAGAHADDAPTAPLGHTQINLSQSTFFGRLQRAIAEHTSQQSTTALRLCCGVDLSVTFPAPFASNFPWRLPRRFGHAWYVDTDGIARENCLIVPAEGSSRCINCDLLADDKLLLDAIERAHDPKAHLVSHVPDCFLSDSQLALRNVERRRRESHCRLRILGQERHSLRLLTVLSDYKRIVLLCSSRKIQRVHQLFSQMIKYKRSAHYIVATLEKAVAGLYHPKGYSLEDLEDTFMALKLGSRALVYAQNHGRGGASVNSLRSDVLSLPRVVCEAGLLSIHVLRVMRENYERFVFAPTGPPGGMATAVWSIMIDDVNCNREVRPSPHAAENGGVLVLGICRCSNTRHVSTTVHTMDDLEALKRATDSAPCGLLAEEITYVTIARNGRKDYSPKVLMMSGTCKKGDQSEEVKLMIVTALKIWGKDPRGLAAKGPIATVYADGASSFVKGAHEALEKDTLPFDHPLYEHVSAMKGFNMEYTLVCGMAVARGGDPKHDLKRTKEAFKSLSRETQVLGPSGPTLGGRRLRHLISEVRDDNGNLILSSAQVGLMFASGFADAQNVPNAVLFLLGVVSLGDRAAGDFDSYREHEAQFAPYKPSILILAEYSDCFLTLLTRKIPLREQVKNLSRLAFHLLALYSKNGSRFASL